jgi:integrase/recombinase XerC
MSKPKRKKGPQAFYKQSHKAWYIQTRDGKQHRLAADNRAEPVWPPDDEADRLFHEILGAKPKEKPEPEPIEPSDDPTVAGLVDDFLTAVQKLVDRGKLASRTFDWYDEHLQRFGKFIGPEITVSEFKKSHVKKWLEKDYPHAGDNYLNGAVRAVSRVFNWAKEEERLTASPMEGYKREPYTPRECCLTDDQWQQVIAELKDDDFADFVWFLYLTGCRPHEARIAKDFHLDNDCLIFERVNSKGKKVRRVILLEGKELEIVQRRVGNGHIFTNKRGNAWTSYALNCRFSRLREKLKFEVFPYIFRHTFATRALKRGLHPMVVASLWGHKDATMVMKVYGHLAQDSDHLRAELRRATA